MDIYLAKKVEMLHLLIDNKQSYIPATIAGPLAFLYLSIYSIWML